MQYKITTLAAIVAFISGTNAVWTCEAYDNSNGQCLGTCTEHNIAVGQTINVGLTACIFNTVTDPGFDAIICSGPDLTGSCSLLSTRRRETITGDFNWDAGRFTRSMRRTGN